ncbi:MAG: hypothetical protein ABR512_08595 [Desulfopila sp.]
MQPLSSHLVLVAGQDYSTASAQVQDFFDTTLLVQYDRAVIRPEKSCSAGDADFAALLEKGVEANRTTLEKFVDEFAETGFQTVKDLHRVECGYPSKLLHIITHFVDGFIGIDTKFYNLIDDSHWLPENTAGAIVDNPAHYWLIHLDGYSETPEKVSLVQT